ncbi:unnamed protein product [Linum trigynum]|uniref:Beta'-coat protein n=1 Tax=Linum trigynum TaxID=586398 RepID=A0AAV2FNM6_9ROSI
MTFQIEKTFSQASERVKSVEFHPTQPWVLLSMHSGEVRILNFQTQEVVGSFKATDSPVRTAKFVPRKQWIVTGTDDGKIRVYDQDSRELVKEVQAHEDFIRSLCPHPTLPILLSAGDDKVVKIWDWDKDWECARVFRGHSHYVMQTAFNPLDHQSFATASLDNAVKIWNIGSPASVGSLDGHAKGVNCVTYLASSAGDPDEKKLYLLSGSDDFTVKVWDCDTNCCVRTLEGHTNNVSAVAVHPELPIFVSVSEDGTVIIWDATTFKAIETMNYGLDRVWAIGCRGGSNQMAFGCDKGTAMVNVSSSS